MPFRPASLHLLVPALLLLALSTQGSAEDGKELDNPALKSLAPALAGGTPLQLLPPGAFAYCSLANPRQSLLTLDALLQRFLPEQAVPAPMKPLLSSPTPILAMIGMATLGSPQLLESAGPMTGLDLARPVTLSWYLQDLPHGWVLSLPIGNEEALTGLVMGMLRPTSCTQVDLNGKPAWSITSSNENLPDTVLLLRSSDTVLLCGSQALAMQAVLHTGSLQDDPLLAHLGTGDVELGLSPHALQPMLGMVLAQLHQLTPAAMHQMRGLLTRSIPAEAQASINLQLRLRTGLKDVDQLLDYAECVAAATNAVMVPEWGKTLMGIQGLELRTDLTKDGAAVSCSVHAEGIEAQSGSPVPMQEVSAALASLPWTPLSLSVQGQTRPCQSSALLKPWCDAIAANLKAAGLDPGLLGAMMSIAQKCTPPSELSSKVPWLLSCSGSMTALPKAAATVMDYVKAVQALPSTQPELLLMPDQGPGFPASFFADEAASLTANHALQSQLLKPFLGDDAWIDPVWRFRTEERSGKPSRLVCESAYITRSGLFGYSQHELIDRTIYYVDHRGPYCLVQRAEGDAPTWLEAPPAPPAPTPTALTALLNSVEPGCNHIAVVRLTPLLPMVIDGVAAVELTVHTEIDDYLRKVAAVINLPGTDQATVLRGLAALPMPFAVASLNVDATHKPYCVLLGNLRYPRPMISDTLRGLVAAALPDAGHVGGLVISTRAAPGLWRVTMTQDLRGLALLVKSTGNAVFAQFLNTPDPKAALQQAIGTPLDGEANPAEEVLLYSPLWPQPGHPHRRRHRPASDQATM